MSVKVCDAICGAGKTSAAINLMNSSTDKKYIFVTQYLSEVDRVKICCPLLDFASPMDDDGTKLQSIRYLLKNGRNIATTHALFLSITEDIKEYIISGQYTLILDEVVDVLVLADMAECDVQLLRKSGLVQKIDDDTDAEVWDYEAYGTEENSKFSNEMRLARSHNFFTHNNKYFYWAIAPELFTCFTDVIILSYLFEYQPMRYFFNFYQIDYQLVGTKLINGRHQFCDIGLAERDRDLRGLIHILDEPKLNAIGDGRFNLSHSWYKRHTEENRNTEHPEIVQLRKNMFNVLKNRWEAKQSEIMWSVYKEFRDLFNGGGYNQSFLPFNKRATNDFSSRKYLAYCVNISPNTLEVMFYRNRGITIDSDMYALSTMVQWLFRSAIRNGEEIYLYLPSVRMRSLLTQWLDNLAEGNDLEPVAYVSPRKYYYVPKKKHKNKKEKKQ